jgi:hypothetical protein
MRAARRPGWIPGTAGTSACLIWSPVSVPGTGEAKAVATRQKAVKIANFIVAVEFRMRMIYIKTRN